MDNDEIEYRKKKIYSYKWHLENNWSDKMKIYKINKSSDLFKNNLWVVLLINSNNYIVVTDITDKELLKNTIELTKNDFFNEILKYEDENFVIYYKQIEQYLVGYLLDFFIYYVEMPEKIKTVLDDNFDLYVKIKNQKFK